MKKDDDGIIGLFFFSFFLFLALLIIIGLWLGDSHREIADMERNVGTCASIGLGYGGNSDFGFYCSSNDFNLYQYKGNIINPDVCDLGLNYSSYSMFTCLIAN